MVEPAFKEFKSFKTELLKRLNAVEILTTIPIPSDRQVKLLNFRTLLRSIPAALRHYKESRKSLENLLKKFAGDTTDIQSELSEPGFATIINLCDDRLGILESQIESIESADEKDAEKERKRTLLEVQINEERRRSEAYIRLQAQENAPRRSSTSSLDENDSRIYEQQNPSVRLPQFDAPIFDGSLHEFQPFIDAFQVCIGNQTCISDTQKFHYLKSKLKPGSAAAKSIEGIPVTGDNYEKVLRIIKTRFGDKTMIKNHHYNLIMDAPIVDNKTTVLREFFDLIEANLNSLSTLGDITEGEGALVNIIKRKLPKTVIKDLIVQNNCYDFTLETLRQALHNYIIQREMIDLSTNTRTDIPNNSTIVKSTNSQSKNTNFIPYSKPKTTTSTLFSNNQRSEISPDRINRTHNCGYCNENHWSTDCQKFKTLNDRKKKLTKENRCFNCLALNHTIEYCKSRKFCFYCLKKNVVSWHHQSICPDIFSNQYTSMVIAETSSITEKSHEAIDPKAKLSLLTKSTNIGILMQTATAPVCSSTNREHKINAKIILDTASQRSFITTSLAKKLRITTGPKETIMVQTFGGKSAKAVDTYSATILLKTKVETEFIELNVNITETITGYTSRPAITLKRNENEIINSCLLADTIPYEPDSCTIDLLIGSDYYTKIITFRKIEVSDNLCLISSRLGWLLTGQYEIQSNSDDSETNLITTITTLFINQDAKNYELSIANKPLISKNFDPQKFWALEHIGINENSDDINDETALQKFNETIQYTDKRYYVKWPWIDNETQLLTNYQLSLGRLKSLIKRYKNDKFIFEQYQAILDAQLDKGIIEKVNEVNENGNKKHYIPHHAIITPEKTTTKLRIVYDGSAKMKNDQKSLNECLYRGPIMLDNVVNLLIRFQLFPMAVVADIEKAFLQVGLQNEDRDVTRFLWLKDTNKLTTENNLQIYRFMRVPFGINSSPFLLMATIQHHLCKINTDVSNKILENIYVDNVITGVENLAKAVEFYKEAKDIFASASMNLREWNSNDKKFLSTIPEFDCSNETHCKILGLKWDTQKDQLTISIPQNSTPIRITKRTVLRFISSIFDPLGYLCPIILPAKRFLQRLWEKKISWDDDLTAEQMNEWLKIVSNMMTTPEFTFARFISGSNQNNATFELHCFCDASGYAYACCIYLRILNDQMITTRLIFAKSRLAPIMPKQTIPRLELIAAEIGSKCLTLVLTALKSCLTIDQIYLWSDSTCVIHWLVAKQPETVFVRNRVQKIKSLKNLQVLYIPGHQNPADIASRGISTNELLTPPSIWWTGPTFLQNEKASWPKQETFQISDHDSEMKIFASFSLLSSEGAKADERKIEEFDLLTKYSNLNKLLRITAYIFRFYERVKDRRLPYLTKLITSNELKHAKDVWIQYIQRQHFEDIIKIIKDNQTKTNYKKRRNPLFNLDLFMNNNIIRCKGRLINAELPDETKFPILLPKYSTFTRLIITDIHERYFHVGVSHTLTAIRKTYWIPSGRRLIYQIIRSCGKCKRVNGGPYKAATFPALPAERVTKSIPFSTIGLDYFGPLYVKNSATLATKTWACLFTCLTTRAIHLELVNDMSAEEFLLSIRRFIARRGKPTTIYCDNAPHFKLVSKVMDKFWNSVLTNPKIINFSNQESINWKFITEHAPWKGGFYERLIGIVKNCLKRSIGRITLTTTQLQTLLNEIEAVVNSRPLTYVGSDFDNGFQLTPAHFLTQNTFTIPVPGENSNVNDDEYLEKISSKEQLLKIWKRGNRRLDEFWKHWQSLYLTSLRERLQLTLKQPRILAPLFPNIGDIVLIKDNKPRGSWPLGRIRELLLSKDNQIRSAKVQLPSGMITRRAIAHLYPMECTNEENYEVPTSINKRRSNEDRPERTRRQTADKAAGKIRKIYAEESYDSD